MTTTIGSTDAPTVMESAAEMYKCYRIAIESGRAKCVRAATYYVTPYEEIGSPKV